MRQHTHAVCLLVRVKNGRCRQGVVHDVTRIGKLRQEAVDRGLLGRTGDGFAQIPDGPSGAQPRKDLPIHVRPCGRFAARQRLLQAEAVVQAENGCLPHRTRRAAGDRLVGVAFELDWAAVPYFRQQAAARRTGAAGRRIVLRPSRHYVFRLDEVRHGFLYRGTGACGERSSGESEPGGLEDVPSRGAQLDLAQRAFGELSFRRPREFRGIFPFRQTSPVLLLHSFL